MVQTARETHMGRCFCGAFMHGYWHKATRNPDGSVTQGVLEAAVGDGEIDAASPEDADKWLHEGPAGPFQHDIYSPIGNVIAHGICNHA